jgi:hypothetical protein
MELAHFLESDDGRKRLARHFEVRRTCYLTSWYMRKGEPHCSNRKRSSKPLHIRVQRRRAARPSDLERPLGPGATWTWTLGHRLQARVYAVPYCTSIKMRMASSYGKSRARFLTFKLARGTSSRFPSSYLLHPSESWFRPLFLVFPASVRICFKLLSRRIFNRCLTSD